MAGENQIRGTKNLGLIKAIHVGINPPLNTKIVWYDDNIGVKYHKYYDTETSTWKRFGGDIDDSNFVHKTGDEEVDGVKSLLKELIFKRTTGTVTIDLEEDIDGNFSQTVQSKDGVVALVSDVTELSDNTYTKAEVDAKVSSVYRAKGNKDTYADLPATGNVVGDVWNVLDTGMNYAWTTESTWDNLGAIFDLSSKLDKGTYPGDAGDLKADIDAIYQPNLLISSVPPTRLVDTFTYPANQYQALINKTIRTNPAAFVTTISPATPEYKRTDLIWFKSDNTLVKTVGVENLTAAVRPDIPIGQVGVPISYINVFGAVIDNPIPVTQEISIQDSLGVERFKVPENGFVRFKGVAFNSAAKQIEINPLTARRIFLSSTGNDSTAEIQDSTKPYKTINAVVMYLMAQSHRGFDWYIETLDSGTFVYDLNMIGPGGLASYLRGFNIINGTGAKIVMANNFEVREQFILNFSKGTFAVRTTDTAIQVNACYMFFACEVFKWDIDVFEMETTASTVISMGRGFFRSFCANRSFNYIKIRTLNKRLNTPLFADLYPSAISIDIDALNDYQTSDAFFNNNTSMPTTVNIGTYTNGTSTLQTIEASNLFLRTLVSATAPVNLSYNILNLIGTTNYTNARLCNYHGDTIRPVVNGNGNVLNLNFTVAGSAIFNAALSNNNSWKTGPGRTTTEVVLKDMIMNITNSGAGAVIALMYSDLRAGRYGVQLVLDNFTLNTASNINILYLNNWLNADASFQVIFKNSVNIYNNTYLIQGNLTSGSPANISKEFIVQELASIYHNFGRIHSYVVFPPINQYNTYNNIKRNEIRVDRKEQIIAGALRSDFNYIIDGTITLLTGEYIDIPTAGATISGYGFDMSKINKNVAGQSIFRSVAGGCGNVILKDVAVNSGLGSVFLLTDVDGSHAIEFNDVNFENSASLGTMTSFRQFTGTTCGFYFLSDGLTLEGNWSGFKLTNSNVIGFGGTGTLFKKGTATVFSNRFYIDLNIQVATGSKICDFTPANFTNDKSLQVVNCYTKVNGVVDPSTTNLTFPNIAETNVKAYFVNNIGIKNSYITPYGISGANMLTYADDAAALAGGIIAIGQFYIETSTGYLKQRLT